MKKCAILTLLLMLFGPAVAQENTVWYNNSTLRQQLDISVAAFFGNTRGAFVRLTGHYTPGVDKKLLTTQFLGVFDGVPQDFLTTRHGYAIYSGCQPHNCGVAAAVLTAPGSTMIDAAALIHWRCGRANLPMNTRPAAKGARFRVGGCDDIDHPTVTIFFAHKGTVDEPMAQDLKEWAKKRLSDLRIDGKTEFVTVAVD